MKVFRLQSAIYPNIDGKGASSTNLARWNKLGTPLIYTSTSLALAILELLANMDPQEVEGFLLWNAILPTEGESPILVPKDWLNDKSATQQAGEDWSSKGGLWSKVPSSLVRNDEENIIINPLATAFSTIQFTQINFTLDPRLSSLRR
jgi:hypothetical protein